MLAQVSLIPAESKKLIAKGIARMDIVQKAVAEAKVVIHPSSSTFFLVEELTGAPPPTKVWVNGVIIPKGLCSDYESVLAMRELKRTTPERPAVAPDLYPFTWVVRKGKLETGEDLGAIIAEMTSQDVYIKGANAIDINGKVGVLYGNIDQPGGAFGRAVRAAKEKKFPMIFPAGLEKLIPIPINNAAKAARPRHLDYSMGIRVGLMPGEGTSVTEIDAIKLLSGCKATPIACGGLSGGEGSVVLIIEGSQEQVNEALKHITSCKGARLPTVRLRDCGTCDRTGCSLAGAVK